jgi:chromosome segregation ATPase
MDRMSDWTAFGRIDEDGTVYVKTAAGERVVGSWQAGTPEEGLAHFARRFADIVTEVDLIEARLGTGAADAAQAVGSLRRIRTSLDEAHVVGDLDGLASRLDKLVGVAEEKASEARAARDAARVAALARKTALAEEAEQIAAESTQWKTAGDRLREILDEWKTIKGIEKKTDSELWKRYSAARDAFTRRRGTHFASLDAQRKQASGRKEELVAEAESLSESTEWSATANRLKELMGEWKAAPRAAKDVEQKLWERFRAAQDQFFARRSEVFSARDAEHKAAVDKRQSLVVEAEALDVDADPRAAQARLREIQGQWHDAGRVPRESAAGLDRRMRAVEERVRAAMDSAWRRTTPESNPLLSQMRDQVAEAEQRLARAQAAGDAKRVREAEDALQSKRRFLELAEHSS